MIRVCVCDDTKSERCVQSISQRHAVITVWTVLWVPDNVQNMRAMFSQYGQQVLSLQCSRCRLALLSYAQGICGDCPVTCPAAEPLRTAGGVLHIMVVPCPGLYQRLDQFPARVRVLGRPLIDATSFPCFLSRQLSIVRRPPVWRWDCAWCLILPVWDSCQALWPACRAGSRGTQEALAAPLPACRRPTGQGGTAWVVLAKRHGQPLIPHSQAYYL